MAQLIPTENQLVNEYGFTKVNTGPPAPHPGIWKFFKYHDNGHICCNPNNPDYTWNNQQFIGGIAADKKLNIETEQELLTTLKVLGIPAP